MGNDFFNKRYENPSEPSNEQESFNNLVNNYNDDFLFFLRRAASGYYKGLLSAGRTLKDLHELIGFMQSATGLRFEVTPLPFTFRHGTEYYRSFGFKDQEIDKIHAFFDYVKEICQKDFEECIEEIPEHLYSEY